MVIEIKKINQMIDAGDVVKAKRKYHQVLSNYSQMPAEGQAKLYPLLRQLHKKL